MEEKNLEVDEVLINIGFSTSLGPIREWGLELDKNGIVVTSRMETSIPGVFAAGDVASYPRQAQAHRHGIRRSNHGRQPREGVHRPGQQEFPGPFVRDGAQVAEGDAVGSEETTDARDNSSLGRPAKRVHVDRDSGRGLDHRSSYRHSPAHARPGASEKSNRCLPHSSPVHRLRHGHVHGPEPRLVSDRPGRPGL